MSIVLSGAQGVKLGDLVSSQSTIPDRDLFNRSRKKLNIFVLEIGVPANEQILVVVGH
jgi:hypothetical protein